MLTLKLEQRELIIFRITSFCQKYLKRNIYLIDIITASTVDNAVTFITLNAPAFVRSISVSAFFTINLMIFYAHFSVFIR